MDNLKIYTYFRNSIDHIEMHTTRYSIDHTEIYTPGTTWIIYIYIYMYILQVLHRSYRDIYPRYSMDHLEIYTPGTP